MIPAVTPDLPKCGVFANNKTGCVIANCTADLAPIFAFCVVSCDHLGCVIYEVLLHPLVELSADLGRYVTDLPYLNVRYTLISCMS